MPLHLNEGLMGVWTLADHDRSLTDNIDPITSIILQCDCWGLEATFKMLLPFILALVMGFCFCSTFIKNARDTMVTGEPVSSKASVECPSNSTWAFITGPRCVLSTLLCEVTEVIP